MKILIACEFSGIVRDAFLKRGHDALSCDLLPTESPGPHYQGDVLDIINDGWDMMIGHPPCTYLANSGVMWLHLRKDRWDQMREGAEFFKTLLNANIPKIAIENPIMHKYALEIIGVKQTQSIQPWQFGHMEKKRTCLWLKGLSKLIPTTNLEKETNLLPMKEQQRLHYLSPGKDRAKLRSKTFKGIAQAFANQWG